MTEDYIEFPLPEIINQLEKCKSDIEPIAHSLVDIDDRIELCKSDIDDRKTFAETWDKKVPGEIHSHCQAIIKVSEGIIKKSEAIIKVMKEAEGEWERIVTRGAHKMKTKEIPREEFIKKYREMQAKIKLRHGLLRLDVGFTI